MITKKAPDNLINMFQWFTKGAINENIEKVIVAGGFIRAFYAGEEPSDLDLYFRTEEDLIKVEMELTDNDWILGLQTGRAKSMKKDGKLIQLISYLYGEPGEVINLFDFTVCCAAMIIKKEEAESKDSDIVDVWSNIQEEEPQKVLVGEVILHDDFFEHLAGRILHFISTPLPISSLKRAFKYQAKGYHICDENLLKLAEAICRQVNFDDEGNLTEHIQGIDPNDIGIRAID